jgi:hypothetical protein
MTAAPDIAELARQGIAVIVGSRDPGLRPAVTRGWGPVLSAHGTRLELCVDAPAGSDTEANLRAGSPLAVTLGRPSTYLTVQLKGPLLDVRPPDAAARRQVAEHMEAFVAETNPLGVAEAVVRATLGEALLAVAIEVAERYDQTPGPGAGRAL